MPHTQPAPTTFNTLLSQGNDVTDHLKSLGTGRLETPTHGPSQSLLEAFPNRFAHRPYVISLAYPEYTSLCPVTGQPDFGTIIIEYIPHERCVESKSFKLYMFAYRNHQAFMESVTNTVLEDLVAVLDPCWCRVKGLFAPRGGTHIHVFAEHTKTLSDPTETALLRTHITDWKQQPPHAAV